MEFLILVNAPTKLYISDSARKHSRILYGDDTAAFMMESVRNAVTESVRSKSKTVIAKLLYKIRPQKEM